MGNESTSKKTVSPLERKSALSRYWGDSSKASMSAEAVVVEELPFQGVIKIQCRGCLSEFVREVAIVLGFELPLEPNTRAGESSACLWVAPNEWILVTPPNQDRELAALLSEHLETTLPEALVAVTVITDSRVVLSITGAAAADLIAKGCGLDLDPQRFTVEQCAVSHLEQVPFMLYAESEIPNYRIIIERSYVAFVWTWLSHAIKEFNYIRTV